MNKIKSASGNRTSLENFIVPLVADNLFTALSSLTNLWHV